MGLEGMIDFSAELKKLEKERKRLQGSVDGLLKKMSIPGYEEKIRADVRAKFAAKFADTKKELENTLAQIAKLEAMMK